MKNRWFRRSIFCTICAVGSLNVVAQAADFKTDSHDNSIASSVVVSTFSQYFRPTDPSAPQSPSRPTGTRRGGCFDSEKAPVIFAPYSFVGVTADIQPSLTWSFPDDEPVPVELSVHELQSGNSYEIKHAQVLDYEAGINSYQLPAEVELAPGKRYLWQLVLHCNPNRPSSALVYQAEMEFVPTASAEAIGMAGTVVEQARVLANSGYWYDAIAILGTSQQPDVMEMRSALLNDLVILEANATDSDEIDADGSAVFVENLRRFINELEP